MEEFNPDALSELFETAAEKISQKVGDVVNDIPKYERSWIWELIQNAKDNVASDFPNQQVSIQIDWTDKTSFKFSHNFGYFTRINVEGIIRQRNKKDERKEDVASENHNQIIIGRFGTGFMTTHLLSRKVDVTALYRKGEEIRKFVKFPLDRTYLDVPFLLKSIKNSFESARQSIENAIVFSKDEIDFSAFNTSFEYILTSESAEIVEKGIDDLSKSLPFTFVFVDGIKHVKLNLQDEVVIFEKGEPELLHDNIYKVIIFHSTKFEKKEREFIYARGSLKRIYHDNELDIDIRLAIEVESDELGNTFIKQFEQNLPYIFLDFPLIGTEDFYFPTIINFPLFHPTEPRDGIYLEREGEKNHDNQEVFQASISLFSDLIRFAQSENWNNLFHLAKTKLPKERAKFSETWFKENVQEKLREILLDSEIVHTDSSRIILSNALFPYNKSESKISQIWDLGKPLYHDRIPKKEHAEIWCKIIDASWRKELRFGIKKIVEDISHSNNLSNLCLKTSKNEEETILWIDEVIKFAIDEDIKLLSEFAIIPNQYGDFKKIDDLWEDNKIPAEIKEALKLLNSDWCPSLKHNQILSVTIQRGVALSDAVAAINKVIKEGKNEHIKKCVLYLLSCVPSGSTIKDSRSKYFYFAKSFYSDCPEEKIVELYDSTIWEECEKWIMKMITHDVSLLGNLDSLSAHLEKSGIHWLSELISFISAERCEVYLNDYRLLPNQNGSFRFKKELFVDNEIDEVLKEILEGLGEPCRDLLLAGEIYLDIEGKEQSSSDIATKIGEKVLQIYRHDLGRNRDEATKQNFEKLLLWMHYKGKGLATELFGEVYEKRVLYLRTIEENIADIEFKQNILNNKNGYTEEDILNFINTPKDEQVVLTREEYENLKSSSNLGLPINWNEIKFNGEEEESVWKKIALFFLETLGEIGINDVQNYLFFIGKVKNKEILIRSDKVGNSPDLEFDRVNYKIQITSEAVAATIPYLENRGYVIIEFDKEYPNILKVRFNGKEFKIVIRPSHGRRYQVHSNERNILLTENAELWLSDGVNVVQETLNSLLLRIFSSGTVFIPTDSFVPGRLIGQ